MDRRRRLLQKQLDAAVREETRLLSPKAPGRLEQTIRKAEERFPPGAVSALQKAFGLGFEKVFASGTGVIEWTGGNGTGLSYYLKYARFNRG